MKVSESKAGMVLGVFAVIVQSFWALIVYLGIAQPLFNWGITLHFLNLTIPVAAFSSVITLMSLIFHFVAGYLFGWFLAYLWNRIE